CHVTKTSVRATLSNSGQRAGAATGARVVQAPTAGAAPSERYRAQRILGGRIGLFQGPAELGNGDHTLKIWVPAARSAATGNVFALQGYQLAPSPNAPLYGLRRGSPLPDVAVLLV